MSSEILSPTPFKSIKSKKETLSGNVWPAIIECYKPYPAKCKTYVGAYIVYMVVFYQEAR
jgi:hypothetical protein